MRRLALLALCSLVPACGPRQDDLPGSARGRNLLLVTIDTLRADRLGCYGGPQGLTRRERRNANKCRPATRGGSLRFWTAPRSPGGPVPARWRRWRSPRLTPLELGV